MLKNSRLSLLRWLLLLFGTGIVLLFSPFFSRVLSLGTYLGEGIGMVLLLIGSFLPSIRRFLAAVRSSIAGRILLSVLTLFLTAGIGLALFCTGKMIAAANRSDPPADATVIVLGCQVDSNPLLQRVEAAAAYLSAHPDAAAILSGGKGSDESISEAQAMKNELLARGIAPERLYLEDRSTNTEENLRFSAEIIAEKRFSRTVAIVTQSFHQCRAGMHAEANGLIPSAVVARCTPSAFPTYFLRDLCGVMVAVVFGS